MTVHVKLHYDLLVPFDLQDLKKHTHTEYTDTSAFEKDNLISSRKQLVFKYLIQYTVLIFQILDISIIV